MRLTRPLCQCQPLMTQLVTSVTKILLTWTWTPVDVHPRVRMVMGQKAFPHIVPLRSRPRTLLQSTWHVSPQQW